MTLREFHNALCILRSIDRLELEKAGVLSGVDWWYDFRDRPHDFFMRADDATQAAIWAIVQRRMT